MRLTVQTARTRSSWCGLALIMGLACGCGSPTEGTGSGGGSPDVGVPRTTEIPKAASKKAARPGSKIVGDRMANAAPTRANPTIPQEPSPFRFEDALPGSGIDFVHFSGMTETKHFPTANGSGAGLLDYDGDGLLDIYFCTATLLPLGTAERAPNRLYRNLGNAKFEDVTEKAGVGYRGFCHGVIAGDFDNDGDPDMLLAVYGSNVLYQNNGDGTFTDVSARAGIDKPGWSSGGATLDYDNDGDLDIYVSNYGVWMLPEDDVFCGDTESNVRFYCSPRSIKTTKHFFYRNNGDGTFTDIYDEFLVDSSGNPIPGRDDGHGFGVVTADLNGDGKVDLYVANDMNPNFLFLNRGEGKFEDATESSGAAFDEKGQAQSGMGVDAEDVDGNGTFELFVTNFQNEYNTLYQNLGNGGFMDNTAFFGLAADSLPWVGWGCSLSDFDNDGWPDAFVANGHVDDNRDQANQSGDYAQPPLLHRNIDGKRFRISTRDVGPYFNSGHVARGAAFGDIDNDGDIDIVVNHKDGAPALLLNQTPNANHWIRLVLKGTKSARDAIGTRIAVELGPRTIHRQRKGGCSLESSNDPRLLIGVGNVEVIPSIVVRWPSGQVSTLEQVPVDQTLTLEEPLQGP